MQLHGDLELEGGDWYETVDFGFCIGIEDGVVASEPHRRDCLIVKTELNSGRINTDPIYAQSFQL